MSLLSKISNDVKLHVIFGLGPPNQKSWLYAYAKIQEILCLVIFLSTNPKTMLSSSREQDIFEDL